MTSELDELDLDILRESTNRIRPSQIVKNLRDKYAKKYPSLYRSKKTRTLDVKVAQRLKLLKDLVDKDDRGHSRESGGVYYSINRKGREELLKAELKKPIAESVENLTDEQMLKLLNDALDPRARINIISCEYHTETIFADRDKKIVTPVFKKMTKKEIEELAEEWTGGVSSIKKKE